MNWHPSTTLLLSSALLAACGYGTTGPDRQPLRFPELSAEVIDRFCIRGAAVPATTVTGLINDEICPAVFPIASGEQTFYETWRVRVERTGRLSLRVRGTFDSTIDIFRMTNLSDPVLDATRLVGAAGSLPDGDAIATATLIEGQEYWVIVSGRNPAEEGSYSLDIL